jgi:hypothetical protein
VNRRSRSPHSRSTNCPPDDRLAEVELVVEGDDLEGKPLGTLSKTCSLVASALAIGGTAWTRSLRSSVSELNGAVISAASSAASVVASAPEDTRVLKVSVAVTQPARYEPSTLAELAGPKPHGFRRCD